MLCASLNGLDLDILNRALIYVSLVGQNAAGRTHGLGSTGSKSTPTGCMCVDHYANGTHLNSTTYELVRPLQMLTVWGSDALNPSSHIPERYSSYPMLPEAEAFCNGSIGAVHPHSFNASSHSVHHAHRHRCTWNASAAPTARH
jgi:hypothetical protein